MDSKKMLILIVVFVLLLIGYYAYAKGIKPAQIIKDQLQKEQDEAIIVEEKKADLIETLSESQKQDAYSLAYDIYEDMKGWNLHKMLLYKKLDEQSNAYLLYFVTQAYPKYDKKPFVERIKTQKWANVSPASKKAGLDDANAERLIQKLKYKIENFKL